MQAICKVMGERISSGVSALFQLPLLLVMFGLRQLPPQILKLRFT